MNARDGDEAVLFGWVFMGGQKICTDRNRSRERCCGDFIGFFRPAEIARRVVGLIDLIEMRPDLEWGIRRGAQIWNGGKGAGNCLLEDGAAALHQLMEKVGWDGSRLGLAHHGQVMIKGS